MERSHESAHERELEQEAEAVRRARSVRERLLSPTERVERLHVLCAQAAAFAAAPRDDRP